MKKFLVRIFTYIVIVCVITMILNSLYVRLDTGDKGEVAKFDAIPDNIEICNLGSSHGRSSYNYIELEDQYVCFNFGLSGQMLSYDYRILDYYQDKLAEGCVVFINISYFSLIGKGEENEESFKSKNKRYYTFLDKKHIKQYDRNTAFIVKYMPSLDARTNFFQVISEWLYRNSHTNMNSDIGTDVQEYQQPQTADSIDLNKYVEEVYKNHLVINKLDENGELLIDQAEVAALYSIIDLCQQKKWTPILVTTPFLSEYTEYVAKNSPEFLDIFYGQIRKVVQNTGVPYYDYSMDERFSSHYELFVNADHLNEVGGKIFVNVIKKEIIDNILDE